MRDYAIVAGVAAVAAYFLTPPIRAYVIRIGALDVPTDRKIHHAPTPTMGGVAVYLGFVVAFVVAALLPSQRSAFRFTEVFGLVCGGFIPVALGIADDRLELTVAPKFAGQFFAAGVLYFSGVQLNHFWLPGIGALSLSPDLSAIVTILWVVALMNAVNFIDGLDGLAAGLSAIAGGALFVYAVRLPEVFLGPDPLAPLAAAAIVGACLGFLPHNFHPAKIIMGDTGAMTLGYLLAGATISLIGRTGAQGAAIGRVALPLVFTPLVFLAIPITDLLFAVVRRTAQGKNPFSHADKEHLHHRMLDIGHSHRRAVLIMYGWALLLASGLVLAGTMPWGRFVLAFAIAGGSVALLTVAPRFRGRHPRDPGSPASVADRPSQPV